MFWDLAEDVLKAPDSSIICYCSQVTKGEILDAIAHGAKSLEDIRRMTGACTIGRCKELSPRKR